MDLKKASEEINPITKKAAKNCEWCRDEIDCKECEQSIKVN